MCTFALREFYFRVKVLTMPTKRNNTQLKDYKKRQRKEAVTKE